MSPNVSTSSAFAASIVTSLIAMKQNPLKRKCDDKITEDKLVALAMYKEDEVSEPPHPPSWEILCLVGPYMDPETLALASCVSTTWSSCFSSESLWKHVSNARFAHTSPNAAIAEETMEKFSYKRFVSVVERAAKRQRKNQPEEPKISLSDLMFIVHVSTESLDGAVYIKGKDLLEMGSDKFQIEVDISKYGITAGTKDVRLMWQVVYKDWEDLFTMADMTRSLDAKHGWFTDELPVNKRYSIGSRGCENKLVGDVKTSYNGEVLENIGFSILDSSWGSLFVNDVLRYFQRFFCLHYLNCLASNLEFF